MKELKQKIDIGLDTYLKMGYHTILSALFLVLQNTREELDNYKASHIAFMLLDLIAAKSIKGWQLITKL